MKLMLVVLGWLPVVALVVFNYRKQIFQWSWVNDLTHYWLDAAIGFRDMWLTIILAKNQLDPYNVENRDAYSTGNAIAFVSFLCVLLGSLLGVFFSLLWALT
jgi:hypothetical protein